MVEFRGFLGFLEFGEQGIYGGLNNLGDSKLVGYYLFQALGDSGEWVLVLVFGYSGKVNLGWGSLNWGLPNCGYGG